MGLARLIGDHIDHGTKALEQENERLKSLLGEKESSLYIAKKPGGFERSAGPPGCMPRCSKINPMSACPALPGISTCRTGSSVMPEDTQRKKKRVKCDRQHIVIRYVTSRWHIQPTAIGVFSVNWRGSTVRLRLAGTRSDACLGNWT